MMITSNCDHPTIGLVTLFFTSISEYIISTVNVLAPLDKKSDFRKKESKKHMQGFLCKGEFPFSNRIQFLL